MTRKETYPRYKDQHLLKAYNEELEESKDSSKNSKMSAKDKGKSEKKVDKKSRVNTEVEENKEVVSDDEEVPEIKD